MGHYTQDDIPPGREQFWKENAVALIKERNDKIERLRDAVRRLEKGCRAHKALIADLREQLAAATARAQRFENTLMMFAFWNDPARELVRKCVADALEITGEELEKRLKEKS